MTKSKHNRAHRQKERLANRPAITKTIVETSFPQEKRYGGLLVTDELKKALEECKLRVSEIASDCRKKNRKFRDIEFDLELDRNRCLHGLSPQRHAPSDVQRVTQIFDEPSFFVAGADSNDIMQGLLGDCWFLSALATMSTSKGLVEKFCVARDEKVGVYGFIFFRDTAWVNVIVDDLLYTSIPKFEELSDGERQLYHNNKEAYNQSARKSGKSLHFSKSGTQGETWVPLIEKAYAKLHGSYAALDGGQAGEAIEDLTGGVTSFIYTKDILDPDAFWTDELLHANTDRLFGCSFNNLDGSRSGNYSAEVRGLMGGHAYSILRAVPYRGKRFLVIRNPWGEHEWTGPWSDGSKEWTPEWLAALPVLGHVFGNDGEFVMEYQDFLENWEQIDRTLLFDSSWIMSSQWLKTIAPPFPSVWSYGDISFTISLTEASQAVIVLSKLDDRYWSPLSGSTDWFFDFLVFKKGESKLITTSSPSVHFSRSVNAELYLDAGEYVVHVRLDRQLNPDKATYSTRQASDSPVDDSRALIRVFEERSKSQSIASNVDPEHVKHLPLPLELLAGRDLTEVEAQAAEIRKAKEEEAKALAAEEINADTILEGAVINNGEKAIATDEENDEDQVADDKDDAGEEVTSENEEEAMKDDKEDDKEEQKGDNDNDDNGFKDFGESGDVDENEPNEQTDIVYLGLRVYTNKAAPAKVNGQLRQTSVTGLAVNSDK